MHLRDVYLNMKTNVWGSIFELLNWGRGIFKNTPSPIRKKVLQNTLTGYIMSKERRNTDE